MKHVWWVWLQYFLQIITIVVPHEMTEIILTFLKLMTSFPMNKCIWIIIIIILDLYRSATNRLRATEETKAWLTSVNYWFISPRVHEVDIPLISVSAARKARDLTVEFNSARCIYFRGKTVRGTKFRGLLACIRTHVWHFITLYHVHA